MIKGTPADVLAGLTPHAHSLSVMEVLEYAAVLTALRDAVKKGGHIEVPEIKSWTPYGKRRFNITVDNG